MLARDRYILNVAGNIENLEEVTMGAAEAIDPNASLWDWLTSDVRRYRTARGQTLTEIGAELKRDKSWVSNVEAGRRRLDTPEAEALDRLWETGGHFARLLHFARTVHDPGWFVQHVKFEAAASVIKLWEANLVPGLLQTADYARALLVAGGNLDVEGGLVARMRRQEVLARESPPVIWALLSEGLLEVQAGSAEVQRDQLGHLLELSELPNVGIRVVPRSAGVHPGLDGSFKIMTGEAGEVAYVEAPGRGRLVTATPEVREYAVRYDRIGQEALPAGPSRDLIRQLMEGMQ